MGILLWTSFKGARQLFSEIVSIYFTNNINKNSTFKDCPKLPCRDLLAAPVPGKLIRRFLYEVNIEMDKRSWGVLSFGLDARMWISIIDEKFLTYLVIRK